MSDAKKGKGRLPVLKVSNFPVKSFREWDKSCKEEFGDSRWAKMWTDHKIAQSLNSLSLRIDNIERVLEEIVKALENKDMEEDKEDVRTLGGVMT